MEEDAIDLKYAKEVADFIGSNHHEIIINKEDVLNAIKPVIQTLATFDITTIRASIGMYLICKAIHEQSNIRVLLTGEISDELFGYKYTDFAPSAQEFQQESVKRVHELYMYDVLRADRCISTNSIEARVPFGDLDFVKYVMAIDPQKKMNTYNKGKYLLRHAFEKDEILPYDILMREKAAFSDAVGHSLSDDIKEYAEKQYTDAEFEEKIIGEAVIRETFKVSKVGTIGGFMVTNGKITRDSSARVIRDGVVIFDGKLASLKHYKDDVKEVGNAQELSLIHI